MKSIAAAAGIIWSVCGFVYGASPYDQDWGIQFETTDPEGIRSLAVDAAGRYYAAGFRYLEMEASSRVQYAAFLQQVLPTGELGWEQQLTAPLGEFVYNQATAVLGEQVYLLSGLDRNGASGSPGLYRYNTAGALESTAVEGFPSYHLPLRLVSLAVDSMGNVVLGGSLNQQAFLAKINARGQTEWVRPNLFATGFNDAGYIAVDSAGSIYVAGESAANDATLRKYDGGGSLLWSREFGTSRQEVVYDLTLDNQGNPVVVGLTYGDLAGTSAGGEDAFVLKVDAGGGLVWATQFGDGGSERAYGVDVAPNGHIFVGGSRLPDPYFGDPATVDALWAELSPDGTHQWTDYFRTAGNYDGVFEILVDDDGDVLLGGTTAGSLFGPHGGGQPLSSDAFLVKFDVNAIPEPCALPLALVAGAAGGLWCRLPENERRKPKCAAA